MRKAVPNEQRLLAKRFVDARGCWNWTGPTNANGYGVIPVQGLPRANRSRLVHRIAASIWLGFSIQSKTLVLHRCDNPRCFNPEHLFLGTQKDNMADCRSKGRFFSARGEASPCAKLNYAKAQEIKRIKLEDKLPNARIGILFGISGQHVGKVLRGQLWL